MSRHEDNVHAAEQQSEDLDIVIEEINGDIERLKAGKTVNPKKRCPANRR